MKLNVVTSQHVQSENSLINGVSRPSVGQPILSDNSSLTAKKYAEPDNVMTVSEVAKFLKCSTKKIYRLCKNEEIPFKRNGGNYRFWRPEIEKWLKGETYE